MEDLSDENLIEVPWSKISLSVTILDLNRNLLTRLRRPSEIGRLMLFSDFLPSERRKS